MAQACHRWAVISLVPVGVGMWGQFLICHTCIAPTRWLHRGALPVDLGGVILSQLLGGCARSTFGSISDSKGWPRGMDLCANGLRWCRLAQDATGLQCRLGTDATRVALACTWVPCASGHTGHKHSCPFLVYSYFVLELSRNGYGHLGRYPLVKPLGSIVPFTGYHSISLLFIL